MSMEAQFYEARRRQSFIDRRQSSESFREIAKQYRPPEYRLLQIPVRLSHQGDQRGRCTCIPMSRSKLQSNDVSIYERHRDIYPRPPPLQTKFKRPVQHAKLHRRFSSTDYLQQW